MICFVEKDARKAGIVASSLLLLRVSSFVVTSVFHHGGTEGTKKHEEKKVKAIPACTFSLIPTPYSQLTTPN